MASSDKSHAASKRLLKELQAYESEPNEALLRLGPLSDGDLNLWIAVMKGISGTAYEGTSHSKHLSTILIIILMFHDLRFDAETT